MTDELSRRRFVQAGGVAAAAVTAAGGASAALTAATAAPAAADERAATLRPAALRTDHLTAPLGIDDTTPTLSWRYVPGPRNQTQTAYQVRVASSDRALERPDLWDSGRVSGAAVEAVYAGRALRSRERASWQVRVWDAQGRASRWSEPSHWEMGLLKPGDWTAQWIGNPAWTDPVPAPVTVAFPARTARYVRLEVTRLGLPIKEGWPDKVSRLQLAAIQVLDGAAPGTDLALHAPVAASESYTVAGQWEPKALTDGTLVSDSAPFGYTSMEHHGQDLDEPIWIRLDLARAGASTASCCTRAPTR